MPGAGQLNKTIQRLGVWCVCVFKERIRVCEVRCLDVECVVSYVVCGLGVRDLLCVRIVVLCLVFNVCFCLSLCVVCLCLCQCGVGVVCGLCGVRIRAALHTCVLKVCAPWKCALSLVVCCALLL